MSARVITIGRECGSGGHTVGRLVAEKLGYTFYDTEIVRLVAQKSDLSEDFIDAHDEDLSDGIFGRGLSYGSSAVSSFTDIKDQINSLQIQVIREAAEKGPCVIVGRGADYILSDRDDCLHVFIYSDMNSKVERSVKEHGLERKKAVSVLTKRDKSRASHYNFYTQRTWGGIHNYNLLLDSGRLGLESCAEMIAHAARTV